jgi:hypothetical protein
LEAICATLVLTFVPQWKGKPVRYAAALSSAAFALFAASVVSCGAGVRSDMLGVALAILGLWMFVRFGDRGPLKLLAFVLFTAAIYCEQTIISAPAARLIAALLISRRFFAQGLGVLLALGGGALAILTYLTSGRFLLAYLLLQFESVFDETGHGIHWTTCDWQLADIYGWPGDDVLRLFQVLAFAGANRGGLAPQHSR